ncbi:MAG TPA: hypothetical protein VLW50_10815 [Streptosporangiaceae bacterium]|nr:hypothetical protein [Streptosporangiaceae bacterium]
MKWRRRQGNRRAEPATKLDREATPADIAALIAFARSRPGVEFYIEPETFATDTTAVAVAADGEWTRRRVGSPAAIRKVARGLRLPVYEAQIVGYPARMRAWTERQKQRPPGAL